MDETDNICFVCDKTIPSEKWKYKLQETATRKRNVPASDLIEKLVGNEFVVLVGERDAVCSNCMDLLNLMDSLTDQLKQVEGCLQQLLFSKYNLEGDKIEVQYDDSISYETEPLHKCNTCSFETKYEKEFNTHIRTHATTKSSTSLISSSNDKKPSKPKRLSKPKFAQDLPTTTPIISVKQTKDLPTKTPLISPKQTKGLPTITPLISPKQTKGLPTIPPIISPKQTKSRSKKKVLKKSPKKTLKKTPKPKKTKVVFQCSVCDQIFPNESLIRTHARKAHGNDNIIVSDDSEYEDIQTLESDEETPISNEVKPKNKSVKRKEKPKGDKESLDKSKLDFLDDWDEDENDTYDFCSPSKNQNNPENISEKTPKLPVEKSVKSYTIPDDDNEEDEENLSSNPTCLFCQVKFSSVEAVQDHIKLSHGNQSSRLSIKAEHNKKETAFSPSVASFEIDSTTDLSESKKEIVSQAKRYKCNVCGVRKVSLQFIKRHIQAHKRKIALQCKLCGHSFQSSTAVKVHKYRCHKVAAIPKKCTYCNLSFFSSIQVTNHINNVHDKKIAKTKTHTDRNSDLSVIYAKLKTQKSIPKPDKPIKRSVSDSNKISFSEVSSTSLENDTDSSRKKTKRNVSITRVQEKSEKLSKSKGKGKLTCLECGLLFPKPSRLLDHLNKHKATVCLNMGICFYCNHLFLDKEQTDLHLSIEHAQLKVKPKCPACGKVYAQERDMRFHYLRTHFNETEVLMKQVNDKQEMKKMPSEKQTLDDPNDVYTKVFKELQDLTGEGNDAADDISVEGSSQISSFPYYCPLCKFNDTDKEVINTHLATHKQNYCNICKTIFSPADYINHIENHSIESKQMRCSECENLCHDEIHLQCHKQKSHSETKLLFKCSMCEKSYFSKNAMLQHKQKMHGKESKKVVSCNHCEKKFYSEREFQTHIEFGHRIGLNCKYCDKSFKGLKKLIRHEKNHLKQVKNIYKCNICGKVLKTQSALKMHKNNHSRSGPLNCEVCNQKFKSVHAWREHSAKHSETQEKKYFCDICGKGFYFYDSHYRHWKLHLDPLNFQCKICRERYQTKQKLAEHQKACRARKQCGKCSKFFETLSDYQNHACLHNKKVAFS